MGMTIKRNQNAWVDFADLRVGAIFIDEDDDVNIKSYNDVDNQYYAVMLNDGLMWNPDNCHKVKEVFPTLIIDKE